MKELVLTCNLLDDPEIIEKYIKYHSADHVWPQVNEAAKKAGFISIRIYLRDTRLVMILTYPDGRNIEDMNSRYINFHSKLIEWQRLMSAMLIAPTDNANDAPWNEMQRIYNWHETDTILDNGER